MAESGSKVLNRIRIWCGSEPAAVLQEQPGQPRGGAVQAPALSEEPDTTPLHSSAPGTALHSTVPPSVRCWEPVLFCRVAEAVHF